MENKFFRINHRISPNLESRFQLFLDKLKEKPDTQIVIMFDTVGGDLDVAIRITEIMRQSGRMFIGIAHGKVDSSAIPIFLSCISTFGYSNCSALIHRARLSALSGNKDEMERSERSVFELIANRLNISIEKVYEMANRNTVIKFTDPLGKKFFLNVA